MTGDGLVLVDASNTISTVPATETIIYTCPLNRYAYVVINLEANTNSAYVLLNTQFGVFSVWKFNQTHSSNGPNQVNWPHAHRVMRLKPGESLSASSIDLNLLVLEEEFVS